MPARVSHLGRERETSILERARRRKLVNILPLAVAVASLLGLIVARVMAPRGLLGGPREARFLYYDIGSALIGSAILYIISRYLSTNLACGLLVLFLLFLAVVSDEPLQVVEERGLVIFTLPIIVSSLLLRPWTSFAPGCEAEQHRRIGGSAPDQRTLPGSTCCSHHRLWRRDGRGGAGCHAAWRTHMPLQAAG